MLSYNPVEASYSIKEAVDRAGIDPKEVEDVVMGCAQQQGTQAINIGRLSGIAAGLPDNVPGMTIDRQCSSGMMAIATASKQVITDNMDIVVAGGVESIGNMLVQPPGGGIAPPAPGPVMESSEPGRERPPGKYFLGVKVGDVYVPPPCNGLV